MFMEHFRNPFLVAITQEGDLYSSPVCRGAVSANPSEGPPPSSRRSGLFALRAGPACIGVFIYFLFFSPKGCLVLCLSGPVLTGGWALPEMSEGRVGTLASYTVPQKANTFAGKLEGERVSTQGVRVSWVQSEGSLPPALTDTWALWFQAPPVDGPPRLRTPWPPAFTISPWLG